MQRRGTVWTLQVDDKASAARCCEKISSRSKRFQPIETAIKVFQRVRLVRVNSSADSK